MSNMSEKIHVGIDVSKLTLDVHVTGRNQAFKVENTQKGWFELLKQLPNKVYLVTMESTGGYEKGVQRYLLKKGKRVSVVNPRQIRDFARSIGKLAKTDKLDARVIAMYSEKIEPRELTPRTDKEELLCELQQRREQLIAMLKQEKNRLEKGSKHTTKSIRKLIKTLEAEIAQIDEEIKKLLASDEAFKEKSEVLQSVPGVGEKTAPALLATLPELGKLTHKEIASLAGLAPFNRDSGFMRGKRTTYGGRASVRNALFMPTLVAIKHNPIIKAFYERLLAVGKEKMVAVTACMHKLLVILNAMMRDGRCWSNT